MELSVAEESIQLTTAIEIKRRRRHHRSTKRRKSPSSSSWISALLLVLTVISTMSGFARALITHHQRTLSAATSSTTRRSLPSAFLSSLRSTKTPTSPSHQASKSARFLVHPAGASNVWGRHYPKQSTTTRPSSSSRISSLLQATRQASTTSTKKISSTKCNSNRPYKLVIVESPSKVKTIEKILQQHVQDQELEYDYMVTSCYGHIRNLPKNKKLWREAGYEKDDSTLSQFPYEIVGVDLEHDYQPTYVLLPGKDALVKELQEMAAGAQQVLLATDPDREGEAIAWHLQQVLSPSTTTKDDFFERLSFAEITPRAIQAAVMASQGQSLNHNLVQAQETRRILDRLAGFTVSPVLWKKIAPGLSAGRVQSVGMALVVQRERERLLFQPVEYWDVQGNFSQANALISSDNDFIQATLVSINGTSLVSGKQDLVESSEEEDGNKQTSATKSKQPPKPKQNKHLLTQKDAHQLVELLEDPSTVWQIKSVQGRERLSYAPEPFKTSTLQQESNQRLGLSVSQTMRTAQQLYEAGWISYMRTDATFLSEDAQSATSQAVASQHGPQYVYAGAKNNDKRKKKKAQSDKVAQEAHEAIRPAIQESGNFAHPTDVTSGLPEVAQKLYKLIYGRTLASRMPPQKTNQTTVLMEGTSADGSSTVVEFRATGSVILEPGFTLEWNRGGDPTNSDRALPPVVEGEALSCHDLDPQSHTTQPPPRYTEASLVKELEALGVGRPSTYAGIVQILRDRAYVGSPTNSGDGARSRPQKAATGAAITAQRAAGGGDLFGARGPLAPSLSAFVVTSLLEKHCPAYVDPTFTAQMEENLDRIAHGSYGGDDDDGDNSETLDAEQQIRNVAQQRVAYLNEFYAGEQGLAAQIKRIDDEVKAEEARRAQLPALDASEPSASDDEDDVDIGLYIGPWGPYIIQKPVNGDAEPINAPLPPGMATDLSTITPSTLKALVQAKQGSGIILGQHPDDGRHIFLKVGRFGAYLQWGEDGEEGTSTHSLPKQISSMRNLQFGQNQNDSDMDNEADDAMQDDLPGDMAEDAVASAPDSSSSLSGMLGLGLEEAIAYCGLPRTVTHLDEKPITAAIGPYGPYLKYNNKYMSLNARDGDVLTVDEETAVVLVTDNIINKKAGPGRGVLAELGEKDGSMVTVKSGRFGAYINWQKVNAKLPPEYFDEPDTMPLEEAWALVQEKAALLPASGKGGKKGGKAQSNLPPAPKRPMTAYLHFCAEKRPEVAKTNKSLGEISKVLAELWKDTSDADRKHFDQLAEVGKLDYAKEKAKWEEECRKLGGGKKSRSSLKGIPGAPPPPKRGKSAYLFFCGAKRSEVSQTEKSLGAITKELARLWAETTDRSEYEAMAEEDKARFEKEKLEYEKKYSGASTKISSGASASKVKGVNGRAATKKSRTKKISIKKTKAKRAPSAYMIFCRETRNEIVDNEGNKMPLGETTRQLAQRWKNCDTETREKFEVMAAEEKEKLLVSS